MEGFQLKTCSKSGTMCDARIANGGTHPNHVGGPSTKVIYRGAAARVPTSLILELFQQTGL